jgi:hypothetical protein
MPPPAAQFASPRPNRYGSARIHQAGAGAFVSDIFREIDEELRRDNLLKLWQRYGRYVIAGIVVLLAVAGGIVLWRDHLINERKALSTRYFAALALAGENKDAEAGKLFADIARSGGGYGLLARFEQAETLAKTGDKKGAEAIYQAIAGDSGVDPEFRDLATLLSVMRGFADADAKTSIARLAPLTEAGKPWRATALELTAAAQLKAGDKAAALAIYKKLADDLSAPERLRARAAEMAAALSP